MTYSVHDEPDFARVYDEDEMMQVRRGDLRALLDLATGSMDFSSGFWNHEETEIARTAATVLGIDPDVVTPSGMKCQYRGHHAWEDRTAERAATLERMKELDKRSTCGPIVERTLGPVWLCPVCSTWADKPWEFDDNEEGTP